MEESGRLRRHSPVLTIVLKSDRGVLESTQILSVWFEEGRDTNRTLRWEIDKKDIDKRRDDKQSLG